MLENQDFLINDLAGQYRRKIIVLGECKMIFLPMKNEGNL
jgi:hypothetical protein